MHLYGLHSHGLDFQKEGLKYIGGLVETTLETRKALLRVSFKYSHLFIHVI